MDLERVTEELKDEETSLKEEQVEEPVPADSLELLMEVMTRFTACDDIMDQQKSLDADCSSFDGEENKEEEEVEVKLVQVEKKH
ncbi:hypothetical protein AOLI_G00226480 [Acnodon oligacanthus]